MGLEGGDVSIDLIREELFADPALGHKDIELLTAGLVLRRRSSDRPPKPEEEGRVISFFWPIRASSANRIFSTHGASMSKKGPSSPAVPQHMLQAPQ